jgi:hypothetical protein
LYYRNAEKSFAHDVKAFLKDMSVKYRAQLFVISAYERVDNSVAIIRNSQSSGFKDGFKGGFL